MCLDYRLDKNKTVEQSIPASYTDILKGTAYIGEFKDRCVILCPSLRMVTDMVKIRTKNEEAHFVVIAGEPLHEPIVQHGPFVRNTKEEIYSTVRDYHDGKNGFEHAAHWRSRIALK